MIVSSCTRLKSWSVGCRIFAKTSEAELTYQKICSPIQIGRSGLVSPKQLVILNKKSHAYGSLILSISKELSEKENTLRACKLQIQCSWTLWENYVKNDFPWKSALAMSHNLLSFCLAATHNVLPSPSHLLQWDLFEESSGFLCKKEYCTLPHILEGCKVSLKQGHFTYRHGSVLLKLIDSLKAFMNGIPSKVNQNNEIYFVKSGTPPPKRTTFKSSILF